MLAIRIILLLLFFATFSALGNTNKILLTADTNHDGKISELTIKNGQDFILVKLNPTHLSDKEMVLQTKNYNLYTTATVEDLAKENAFKRLWIAKVAKDGSIKVYTLSNLSYIGLEKTMNAKGQQEFFLVKKRAKDQIMTVSVKPLPQLIYDPEAENQKQAPKKAS